MPDYYRVLGVDRGATQDEIKRAFRKLAREHHPDASDHPEAEERFKEVNAAYEVLSDPARRQRYDMYGDADAAPSFTGFGDIGDIMESFFGVPFGRQGARGRRSVAERGADVEVRLNLAFKEAVFGTTKDIEITAAAQCERCTGSGCEPGTFRSKCDRCGGTGEQRQVQRSIFGTMMTSRPCPKCAGAGEVAAVPCRECAGHGRVLRGSTVTVEVPAGIENGNTLRVRGKGEAGARGGENGDLYVHMQVEPHEFFQRVGEDLVCRVSIPVTQAILGGTVSIDGLEGEETIEIQPGTQPGTVLKIPGRGVPRLRGRGRGDLVFQVDVEVPKKLSREQQQLVERLAELRREPVTDPLKRGKLRNVLRGL